MVQEQPSSEERMVSNNNTMNTKQLYLILAGIALMGCHKVTVDFSYSPTEPKTGETVTFTNLSENGEDYTWDFGDNRSASTKSPTHTYSKAGTYMVTLSEKRTKKTCTHAVTVTDSLPTIGIQEDAIHRFDSVSLKALVWNPFSHPVTYRWHLDENTRLLSGNLNEDNIVVQFRHRRHISDDDPTTVHVGLDITMDGIVHSAEQTVTVYERKTWSLLFRTPSADAYQLVYLPHYDIVSSLDWIEGSLGYTTADGRAALDAASPTLQATDRMEHKRYTGGSNGLYVSNLNGSNEVQLTADSVGIILLDSLHQRLFYTTAEGVHALPLIYSPNNQSKEAALRINNLTDVTAITLHE